MKLKALVGSGEQIGLFTLPFLVIGLALNFWRPSMFSVGGPPLVVRVLSVAVLVAGIVVWLWSVVLILTKVPRHELITTGPFALVKHPLYTAVAILVVPWIGLLLNTWLGFAIGLVIYIGARLFASKEEEALSSTFGSDWDEYRESVKLQWL